MDALHPHRIIAILMLHCTLQLRFLLPAPKTALARLLMWPVRAIYTAEYLGQGQLGPSNGRVGTCIAGVGSSKRAGFEGSGYFRVGVLEERRWDTSPEV